MNHAHQKGIIHRDLKPSNILVGIDGNTPIVKVIDFGVAKALQQQLTEKTLFTRYEQFLGTPLYVSPEQANLSPIDVDTRSDIYSLGVILYELLAGKPPVDAEELHSAGFDEMRRLIREKEALKPSTRFNTASEEERNTIARNRNTEPHRLSLRVKGDLDWIVLKALEKDRGRRYETANAFAEDIRRHLADEPVTAAAPSRVYRFRKLLRRNRTAFGAAAVVLIALLAGLAVSTWSFLNEKEARRKEEQTRLHAEESERQTRLVASFLQDLLEGINPEFIQGMNLDVLRSRLDRIGTQMEGELPQDSPAAVELLLTLGKVYNALGKSDDARPILEKSLRGARMLDDQPKIVEALVALADAIEGEADPDYNEECSLLNEGMELSREIHGTSHPTSILLLSRLGALKSNKFRDPVGVTQAEEAWRLADQHLAENDPIRASAFGNLYRSKQRQITVEERHTMLAELKSVIESSRGQNHLYWPRAVSDLAFSHLKMEEIEPDRGHLQSALQLAKMADLRSRSILPAGHGEQIDRLWRLAGIQLAAGQLDEARASWEEALKYQRARWGAGIPESSDSRRPRKKLVSMLREAGEDEFADQLQHWEHWDQLPTKN